MMIAPALPWPAAVESVLRIAAMPVAPTVARGSPVVEATAAAPAVVAAVWRETAKRTRDELAARERAVAENLLDDDRCGNGAEHDPEGHDRDTERWLAGSRTRRSGQRTANDGSVMKSRMPWVMSAATAQPSGQSNTPTMCIR